MKKWLLLAALLFPAVWLGAGIWQQERNVRAASEWRIPIEGYDPRDPLRGRYIQFQYAWKLVGDESACGQPAGCRLCLSRDAETVVATVITAAATCAAPVDTRASNMDWRPTFDGPGAGRLFSRIFVSEASAPELEAQLRDQPMVVVTALSPDGRLINRRLEPANPAP